MIVKLNPSLGCLPMSWHSYPKSKNKNTGIDTIKIAAQPRHQGQVVQSFVNLTLSLSPQFASYISTSKANALLFIVDKM